MVQFDTSENAETSIGQYFPSCPYTYYSKLTYPSQVYWISIWWSPTRLDLCQIHCSRRRDGRPGADSHTRSNHVIQPGEAQHTETTRIFGSHAGDIFRFLSTLVNTKRASQNLQLLSLCILFTLGGDASGEHVVSFKVPQIVCQTR